MLALGNGRSSIVTIRRHLARGGQILGSTVILPDIVGSHPVNCSGFVCLDTRGKSDCHVVLSDKVD